MNGQERLTTGGVFPDSPPSLPLSSLSLNPFCKDARRGCVLPSSGHRPAGSRPGPGLVQRACSRGWVGLPPAPEDVVFRRKRLSSLVQRELSSSEVYIFQHLTRTTFFKKYFGDKNAKKKRIKQKKTSKRAERGVIKNYFLILVKGITKYYYCKWEYVVWRDSWDGFIVFIFICIVSYGPLQSSQKYHLKKKKAEGERQ